MATLFSTACAVEYSGAFSPSAPSYGNNNGGNYGDNNGVIPTPTPTPDSSGDESTPEEFLPLDPFEPELPETDDPNPEKTVLSTETDSLGHKIVNYTDGTWEDLGRVEPLDYATPLPTEQYGYTYFGSQTNGEGMQNLYTALYDMATKFHNSANELEITGTGASATCHVARFTLADYGVTQSQAESVWRIFANENPAFFWIDNKISTSSTSLVLLANYEYATVSARTSVQTAVMEMALDCDQYVNGKTSEGVRAVTIHDYLAGRLEYAYKADGVTPETALWAHNIVGAAVKNGGVCETYAKAYDYLCSLFDVDCLTVTGKGIADGSAIGHAWNIVKLDGEWYDVDVTWDDLKAKEISREWFAKASGEFAESHIENTPANGWDLNFQYDLPARCGKSISPVAYGLYDAETYALEGSMQAALDKMTDADKDYKIYLYPHTPASEKMGLTVADRGGVERVTFPSVRAITLVGKYVEYSDSRYTLSEFTLQGDNEVNCHLAFENMSLSGGSLKNNGYTLATLGSLAEIDLPITHVNGESAFCSRTTKATLINGYIHSPSLLVDDGGELRIRSGGTFEKTYVKNSSTLCCYGQENVSFDKVTLYTNQDRIYVAKTAAATKIAIGELIGKGDYATIAFDYGTLAEYPSVSVHSVSGALRVYLYSTLLPATAITLGDSSASVAVYRLNSLNQLVKASYATDSNGNVNYVG